MSRHIRSRAGGFDFIRCSACGKDNRVEERDVGCSCQCCNAAIELPGEQRDWWHIS